MEEIVARLDHWLLANDLKRNEPVRLIVELPTRNATYAARAAVLHEMKPHLQYAYTPFGEALKINGVTVLFVTKGDLAVQPAEAPRG